MGEINVYFSPTYDDSIQEDFMPEKENEEREEQDTERIPVQRKKRKKEVDFETAVIESLQSKKTVTPEEHFLKSLAPQMERLSDEKKSQARIRICQVLHELEFSNEFTSHSYVPNIQSNIPTTFYQM